MMHVATIADAAPSGAPPGAITVVVPTLYGSGEYPRPIMPLMAPGFNCWPNDKTDGKPTRVAVLELASGELRWFGTEQLHGWLKAGTLSIQAPSGDYLRFDTDKAELKAAGVTVALEANVASVSKGGATSSALVDGALGFSTMLQSALAEIMAAMTVLGMPTTNTAALSAALAAGAFTSSTLKAE